MRMTSPCSEYWHIRLPRSPVVIPHSSGARFARSPGSKDILAKSPEVADSVVEDGKAIAIRRGRGHQIVKLDIIEARGPRLKVYLQAQRER